MKSGWRWIGLALLLVAVLLTPRQVQVQAVPIQEVFHFHTYDMDLEILPHKAWEAKFGKTKEIPRSKEAILALALKLYPPREKKAEAAIAEEGKEKGKKCGTLDLGLLFAALQNPEVSDEVRVAVDNIMAASMPPLDKTFTDGHFIIKYTTNAFDTNHNAKTRDIRALASILNACWDEYANNFKKPLADSADMLEVRVYDLGLNAGVPILGRTNENSNVFEIDSNDCLTDRCLRKTISAHELFHRVQFAYGYTNDVSQAWFIEGTAVWAQKFMYRGVGDYLWYMNFGLENPDLALMARNYDAAHLWVYLDEQKGLEAIQLLLDAFEMTHDAETALREVLFYPCGYGGGPADSLEQFTKEWHTANYLKDLRRPGGEYDYDDDETTRRSCGYTYGPLTMVPRGQGVVKQFSFYGDFSTVGAHGADYHEFDFTAGKGLKVELSTISGACSFRLIPIKNGRWLEFIDLQGPSPTFEKTAAMDWDTLGVIVVGGAAGGQYRIKAILDPISGTWTDSLGGTWTFAWDGMCYPHPYGIHTFIGTYTPGYAQCQDVGWSCHLAMDFNGHISLSANVLDFNAWAAPYPCCNYIHSAGWLEGNACQMTGELFGDCVHETLEMCEACPCVFGPDYVYVDRPLCYGNIVLTKQGCN